MIDEAIKLGISVFLNSATVMWLSKKKFTIESSVFGAEFVDVKVGVEAIRGLQHEL